MAIVSAMSANGRLELGELISVLMGSGGGGRGDGVRSGSGRRRGGTGFRIVLQLDVVAVAGENLFDFVVLDRSDSHVAQQSGADLLADRVACIDLLLLGLQGLLLHGK